MTLSSPVGDIVVLRVAGEVDLTSLPVLDAALDDVLDRDLDHVVVDLSAMTFCASRGLTAIARTKAVAAHNGTRYTISGASPLFVRLWTLCWPDREAPRIHEPTATAVLAAIRLQAERRSPMHPGHRPRTIDDTGLLDESTDRRRADDTRKGSGAFQQAQHRHLSRKYRTALHTLGVSYGAHSLAPELAAQLRGALLGFARTPPIGSAPTSDST